jgi:hypothetical protein
MQLPLFTESNKKIKKRSLVPLSKKEAAGSKEKKQEAKELEPIEEKLKEPPYIFYVPFDLKD